MFDLPLLAFDAANLVSPKLCGLRNNVLDVHLGRALMVRSLRQNAKGSFDLTSHAGCGTSVRMFFAQPDDAA